MEVTGGIWNHEKAPVPEGIVLRVAADSSLRYEVLPRHVCGIELISAFRGFRCYAHAAAKEIDDDFICGALFEDSVPFAAVRGVRTLYRHLIPFSDFRLARQLRKTFEEGIFQQDKRADRKYNNDTTEDKQYLFQFSVFFLFHLTFSLMIPWLPECLHLSGRSG